MSVAVPTSDPTKPDYIVEMNLRKFNIITFPRVKYCPKVISKEIFVSRSDTIKEVLVKCFEAGDICNSKD